MKRYFQHDISQTSTFACGNFHVHCFTSVLTSISLVALIATVAYAAYDYFVINADKNLSLDLNDIAFLSISGLALVCLASLLIGNLFKITWMYLPAIYVLRPALVVFLLWAVWLLIEATAYLKQHHEYLFKTQGPRARELKDYSKMLIARDFHFYTIIASLTGIWLLNMAAKDFVYVKKLEESGSYIPANRLPQNDDIV